MPFGYVEAGAAVVGAASALSSSGGQSQQPSAAGWNENAAGLEDIIAASNPQYNPYADYGTAYQQQTNQAGALGQQAVDMSNSWNAAQTALGGQQTALSGQIGQAAQNYLGSGNQAQYLQAMNALVPGYQSAGGSAFGLGNQLASQIPGAQAYGNQIMQTAFDPQNALYNQQNQLQQQQQLANQAQRGLTMSPVGAELSTQANQNFNIGWQNNQLQRQTAGLSAYDANNASIAGLAQGANQSYSQGLQDFTSAAGIPYNAAQQVYTNNQAAYANQQQALAAQYAAQLAAQQAGQQGWTDQTTAFTGQQQALANQSNNLSAGNAWLQQQAQNAIGYYNGSVPSYNQPTASAANGYAGLGNFLGSQGGNLQQLATGIQSQVAPTYAQQSAAALADPNVTNMQSVYSIPGTTPYDPVALYGAAATDTASADAAGFALLGG